jgi:tungstate transport system substrate-binding protein
MARTRFLGIVFAFLVLLTAGNAWVSATGVDEGLSGRIRLATTTSTDNSGLLAAILPEFTAETGIAVDVVAVGTGKALALGRNGDVDVVLVHAPSREEAFVAEGSGVNRRSVMHNDFIILGPVGDPAGISGGSDAAAALADVASTGSVFVSRGDDSGTHTKERNLWVAAGVSPAGDWYREAGQGMGAVMTIASETEGYTLADRGTWLAMRHNLDLSVAVEGDERLFNPYGVIAVNPDRHPHVDYVGAMGFITWLTSATGQNLIGAFTVDGEVLFVPDAVTP